MPDDFIVFTGDWGDHLPEMEKAAEDNEFFFVILKRKEYKQLYEGGLDTLKTRCSTLLADKLYLAKNHMGQGDVLIVLMYGNCP